jgi:hypothetical protein
MLAALLALLGLRRCDRCGWLAVVLPKVAAKLAEDPDARFACPECIEAMLDDPDCIDVVEYIEED